MPQRVTALSIEKPGNIQNDITSNNKGSSNLRMISRTIKKSNVSIYHSKIDYEPFAEYSDIVQSRLHSESK